MPCRRGLRTRLPRARAAPWPRSTPTRSVLGSSLLPLDAAGICIWREMVTPSVVVAEGGQGHSAEHAAGHAQEATRHDREPDARQRRHDAGLEVAERRPDRVAEQLDRGETPPKRVGDGLVPDHLPE